MLRSIMSLFAFIILILTTFGHCLEPKTPLQQYIQHVDHLVKTQPKRWTPRPSNPIAPYWQDRDWYEELNIIQQKLFSLKKDYNIENDPMAVLTFNAIVIGLVEEVLEYLSLPQDATTKQKMGELGDISFYLVATTAMTEVLFNATAEAEHLHKIHEPIDYSAHNLRDYLYNDLANLLTVVVKVNVKRAMQADHQNLQDYLPLEKKIDSNFANRRVPIREELACILNRLYAYVQQETTHLNITMRQVVEGNATKLNARSSYEYK